MVLSNRSTGGNLSDGRGDRLPEATRRTLFIRACGFTNVLQTTKYWAAKDGEDWQGVCLGVDQGALASVPNLGDRYRMVETTGSVA